MFVLDLFLVVGDEGFFFNIIIVFYGLDRGYILLEGVYDFEFVIGKFGIVNWWVGFVGGLLGWW